MTVRVLFSKAVARYIAERLWHPSQKLRELDDGRLEVTLRVADTLEVRRWILGYGVHAEALEPATLREALRAEAEALVDRLAPIRRPLAAHRPPRDDPQLARVTPWLPPELLADHRSGPFVSPSPRATHSSQVHTHIARPQKNAAMSERITDSSNRPTPTAGVTIPVTGPSG